MFRQSEPSDADPAAPLEASGRRRGLALLGIVVLAALAIRLVYLQQISTIPFFDGLISDAQGYDDWARAIAAGDWRGDEPFYQAPAYPYFLALIKVLWADDPYVTRAVQCALGALACGLVGLAGWGFVTRRAGLWAAVLLAVYPPAIFFDGLIQKTSLGQFWGALLLALLAWLRTGRRRLLKNLAAGSVLGIYALTRENALALLPVAGVWLWFGFDGQSVRRRVGSIGLLAAGAALVLLPVGIRNVAVGGEFALTTFQMGPNFYIGNHAEATGRYRPLVKGHETPQFERQDATDLAEQAVGNRLSPRQVSDFWMGQAGQYIRSHPLEWVQLLATKWLLVWNAYEIPDSESYYIYRQWSWLLGTLGGLFHFGVLVPLAAVGAALTWPRRQELWVLYILALVMAASVALFYVFARYRYPLVPVLIVFAGAAVTQGVAAWRVPERRRLSIALAAAAVVAVVCNLPVNPEGQLDAMAWSNLGGTLARQDRLDQAVLFFEKAVEGAPDAAEMRYNLGLAYSRQGRLQEAVDQLRAAFELDPDLVELDYQLAAALERLGQTQDALHHYQRALQANPNDADARAAVQRLSR